MPLPARLLVPRCIQTAALAAAAAIAPVGLSAAETAPPSAPPAQEYVIFVGPDVRVSDRGVERPVVSADERELAILRQGERVRLPVRGAPLKIAMEPKLSRHELSIEQLTGERVYDPRTDPGRESLQQQLVMDSIQAHGEELAEMHAREAADNAAAIARAAERPNSGVTEQDVAGASAEAARAMSKLSQVYSSPISRSWSQKAPETGEGAGYDAFEVTFQLSSPIELADAFGLLRMVVRDPAVPRQGVSVLKFFPLRISASKRHKIAVLQTGLPAGFTVDSYSVHFFSAGRELASNVSQSRVAVTTDEAHQFLVLRHLQLNATASLPAEFIPALLPDDVDAWRADHDCVVDLVIDRTGRVVGLKAVRPRGGRSDAASLETRLRQLRFLPALLDGTPVDSEGTFAISEFAR